MSKILRRIKLFIATMVVLGVPAGLVVGYYTHYHLLAVQLINERQMDTERANAVKHAFAAAQLYQAFHAVGLNEHVAQHLVLHLGKMNEYAEHFLRKKSKRDSNAEMMKDVLNNYIGVEAAKQHMQYAPTLSLLDWVVTLAEKDILVTSASDVPDLSPEQAKIIANRANVPFVMGWFAGVQDTLAIAVDKAFVTALDEEPIDVDVPAAAIKKAQVE